MAETSPVYLHGGGRCVFGMLHMPHSARTAETAVLICPPFGWEDVASYRSRFEWAVRLSEAGHAALRIDLPATGDSAGSPADEGILDTWAGAIADAADWLGTHTECARLSAIGISHGGVAACLALSRGAPIDEIVLWAVPSRGRTLTRELRAFAKLETTRYGASAENEAEPDGSICAGGFLLSPETVRALDALDIGELPLPPGRPTRALLLTRDGIAVDSTLQQHLESAGASVSVGAGSGFGAMMTEPQFGRAPLEVFATVEDWLEEGAHPRDAERGAGAPPARAPRARSVEARGEALMMQDGKPIRERPVQIEQPFGSLFGVLTEPCEGPGQSLGGVFLNAGAIRRIGPNRMWVQDARRWAARGVTTLRLDFEGLGDSAGDAALYSDVARMYLPRALLQTLAALDALEELNGRERFVLIGLCSGAYWAFHGALQDDRVAAAFMLNPRTLFFDPAQEPFRDLRKGVQSTGAWRKVLRGEVSARRFGAVARQVPAAALRRAVPGRRPAVDETSQALDTIREHGKRLFFGFSANEALYEEFVRDERFADAARWPNVKVEVIPGFDHTLRPLLSQRSAEELLDANLAAELEVQPADGSLSVAPAADGAAGRRA